MTFIPIDRSHVVQAHHLVPVRALSISQISILTPIIHDCWALRIFHGEFAA